MATVFRLLLGYMWDCFRSHERLKAEILILRHQLNILHRKAPKRLRLSRGDWALFVWLYRRFPDIGNATAIVRPDTIIRLHRMGFRAWWRWISHNPGGRPGIDQEPRDLVRRMCKENPLWGAPRIHGELLKLGFDIAQSTVSKYMLKRRGPPSQGWKTFLRNHSDGIASVDFIIVPTPTFERLVVFVILGLGRRRLLWIGVTTNPTAEWLARQITEAFPWDTVPGFIIRDNLMRAKPANKLLMTMTKRAATKRWDPSPSVPEPIIHVRQGFVDAVFGLGDSLFHSRRQSPQR